jgi:hypothetical protein
VRGGGGAVCYRGRVVPFIGPGEGHRWWNGRSNDGGSEW